MSHALLDSITEHFADLDDPRRETANRRHEFVDILTLTLCAVIGGANHWTTVVTFAQAKEEWFRRFLRLPSGIPSHDTFSDVFARIDPDAFETGFVAWVAALAGTLPGAPVVAVDGKALRRSHDRANGAKATHIVSAYANASSLVLGQVSTDDKSNEITAIPTLLDMLALDGALVTIDAMGCQTAIADKIVERGADYLLAVKDNQPSLCAAIGDAFSGLRHRALRPARRADQHRTRSDREAPLLGVHRPAGHQTLVEHVDGAEESRGHRVRAHRDGWAHDARAAPLHQQPRRDGRVLRSRRAAGTGRWRTGCTGCWTWRFARTRAGCARGTGRRTCRCSGGWR